MDGVYAIECVLISKTGEGRCRWKRGGEILVSEVRLEAVGKSSPVRHNRHHFRYLWRSTSQSVQSVSQSELQVRNSCSISARWVIQEENFNYFKLACSAFNWSLAGWGPLKSVEFFGGEFQLSHEAVTVNY